MAFVRRFFFVIWIYEAEHATTELEWKVGNSSEEKDSIKAASKSCCGPPPQFKSILIFVVFIVGKLNHQLVNLAFRSGPPPPSLSRDTRTQAKAVLSPGKLVRAS